MWSVFVLLSIVLDKQWHNRCNDVWSSSSFVFAARLGTTIRLQWLDSWFFQFIFNSHIYKPSNKTLLCTVNVGAYPITNIVTVLYRNISTIDLWKLNRQGNVLCFQQTLKSTPTGQCVSKSSVICSLQILLWAIWAAIFILNFLKKTVIFF